VFKYAEKDEGGSVPVGLIRGVMGREGRGGDMIRAGLL